ncbi:M43 family zinc metalloprotease [Dyella sp. M7H15-1]|uniref:M43 family zinc metalloprotease n=1 Tax=Dyella sp. M7H15-1 TaxID=2501295 RepID=UPI0013E8A78B|nr:M43 family zinc metalloprotease [Dyella sp. M7H15-1]
MKFGRRSERLMGQPGISFHLNIPPSKDAVGMDVFKSQSWNHSMKKALLFLSLTLAVSTTVNADEVTRCSTVDPSPDVMAAITAKALATPHSNPPAVIKIAWHEIIKSDGTGAISTERMREQISDLNRSMQANGIPITFQLASWSEYTSDSWFSSCEDNQDMRDILAIAPQNYINVYSCSDASGSLGKASIPYFLQGDEGSKENFVYVNFNTLPGGEGPYAEGATLVHEIGHYLGLVHVFEIGYGVCAAGNNPLTGTGNWSGDFIMDTPPQSMPTAGCPMVAPSTCPGSQNSIHNYMDYSNDICLTTFTPGQRDLMYAATSLLRPTLWAGGGGAARASVLAPIKIP